MTFVKIVLNSLLLTVLIFIIGVLLNYGLDFVRIGEIGKVMVNNEVDIAAYIVEREFMSVFGGATCDVLSERLSVLRMELQDVGKDLASYSSHSWFNKKDFDYLKRKYFLLELQFYALVNQMNAQCEDPVIPILFFYQVDDVVSERQGFVLEDISKAYEPRVFTLAIDKDYHDEPLVVLLTQ